MGDCALPWFFLGSAGPGLLLCWLCWVGGGEAGWLAGWLAGKAQLRLFSIFGTDPQLSFLAPYTPPRVCAKRVAWR